MIDIRNISKLFFIFSLIASAYFLFLMLDYHFFKIGGDTLFEEIRETITLPTIAIEPILTPVTLVLWIKSKYAFPSYLFFAFILSLCNSLSIWL